MTDAKKVEQVEYKHKRNGNVIKVHGPVAKHYGEHPDWEEVKGSKSTAKEAGK